MAKSLVPAMIIGWVPCIVGLVVEPWVLVKARALRADPSLPPQYRGSVNTAYYGALVYCVLAGIGLVLFVAMVGVSAVLAPSH